MHWFSNHWALLFNLFFLIYAGVPVLAPILLANGFPGLAGVIYRAYSFTCHQLPSHSYFIDGYQVALCQRCLAIYTTMGLAGIIYTLGWFRQVSLNWPWFLLFMIPMGLDGGSAWVSELAVVVPLIWFWGLGLLLIAGILFLLRRQNSRIPWQVYLFLLAGPLSLLYIMFIGPHQSNWWLRTITGAIYGVGLIWFIFPVLSESPADPPQMEI